MKKINSKGNAFIWLEILIGWFIIMIIFIVLDQPMQESIIPMANVTGADPTTLGLLETGWTAWPLVFGICLFLYGLLWMLIRSPYSRGE